MRQVSYYLCGEILEPQHYTEMFYTLRTAAQSDLIYLHLNSSGGDFNTGLQIINNIIASEARHHDPGGARLPMAALIFLAGDKLIVHDNCQLMFHIYPATSPARATSSRPRSSPSASGSRRSWRAFAFPSSEAEIGRILKGSDLWMDSDEISYRLMRMQRAGQGEASRQDRAEGEESEGGREASANSLATRGSGAGRILDDEDRLGDRLPGIGDCMLNVGHITHGLAAPHRLAAAGDLHDEAAGLHREVLLAPSSCASDASSRPARWSARTTRPFRRGQSARGCAVALAVVAAG